MFFARTWISTLSSFWPLAHSGSLARRCPEVQTKWNGTWHVTAPIILFRRSRNRLSGQMARSGGESLRWLLMRFTLIGFLQRCLCRTGTFRRIGLIMYQIPKIITFAIRIDGKTPSGSTFSFTMRTVAGDKETAVVCFHVHLMIGDDYHWAVDKWQKSACIKTIARIVRVVAEMRCGKWKVR